MNKIPAAIPPFKVGWAWIPDKERNMNINLNLNNSNYLKEVALPLLVIFLTGFYFFSINTIEKRRQRRMPSFEMIDVNKFSDREIFQMAWADITKLVTQINDTILKYQISNPHIKTLPEKNHPLEKFNLTLSQNKTDVQILTYEVKFRRREMKFSILFNRRIPSPPIPFAIARTTDPESGEILFPNTSHAKIRLEQLKEK